MRRIRPRPSSSARAEKARMSLGRHPPPNPMPAPKKRRPMRASMADRVGELRDVGARDLGDLGHGVDERDLGRQERVSRDLHELGGGVVGHHERRALRDAPGGRPRAARRLRASPARVGRHARRRDGRGRSCLARPSLRARTRGSTRASRPCRCHHNAARSAAVPTGTVDLPATMSPGDR